MGAAAVVEVAVEAVAVRRHSDNTLAVVVGSVVEGADVAHVSQL